MSIEPAIKPPDVAPPMHPTPPTAAGAMPAARPRWPDPLGVILMVFGVLGALNGLLSVVSLLLMGPMKRLLEGFLSGMSGGAGAPSAQAAQASVTESFGVAEKYAPLTGGLGALQVVLGLMLLWAGMNVKSRRRAGVARARWWAVSKAVVVAAQAYVVVVSQQAAMAAMQKSVPPGGGPPGMMVVMQQMAGALGAGMTLIWGWALPVFVLIWFARPVIRGQVRGWEP